jgi:hypothetical protein
MRRVAEAVPALSASPGGFTASELAREVRNISQQSEPEYGLRRAALILKSSAANTSFGASPSPRDTSPFQKDSKPSPL